MARRTRDFPETTVGSLDPSGGKSSPGGTATPGNETDRGNLTGGENDHGTGITIGTDEGSPGTGAGERTSGSRTGEGSPGTGAGEGTPGQGKSTLGTEPRKRGRKPGSKNSAPASLALTDEIVGAHFLLAGITGCPELLVEPEEAEKLSGALNKFAKEFDVKISPKAVAVVGLITTGAAIYGPRALAIYMRKSREKAEKLKKQREAQGQIKVTPEGVTVNNATESAI